jgi:hypothetical protein
MKQTLNFEILNAYVNISCYMLLESMLFGSELLSSWVFKCSPYIAYTHFHSPLLALSPFHGILFETKGELASE